MTTLCIEGNVRASLALYNTEEDIDVLVDSIRQVLKLLGR
jgi:selenocysteine lyase/cysteine desulfurase